MQTVTRRQFKEAIEHGIKTVLDREHDHTLDIPALRVVAATAEVSAVGAFQVARPDTGESCGCPIFQAHNGEYGGLLGDVTFALAYDRILTDILNNDYSTVVRIEG